MKHTFLTPEGKVYLAETAKGTSDIEIDAQPQGGPYYFNLSTRTWSREGRNNRRNVVASPPHNEYSASENQPRQVNSSSGFTWTVKEMLPLLITILAFLGSGVTVYNKLSSDIIIAQQEISHLKTEQSSIELKLESIVKSNENIKLQLEDLRISLMVMMKQKDNK